MLLVATLVLAMPHEASAALQCVTYAREVTGLNLKGDAWKWWEAAQGVYDRGNAPKEGSVLVFKRQGSMSHGHVSVVRRVAGSRMVMVDHANWAPHRSAGRGQVTEGVPVMDVSPHNDWSEVRVWYRPSNEYGSRVYKTQGFVYRPGRVKVQPASLRHDTPALAATPEPAAPAKTEATVTAPVKPSEPPVAAVIAPASTVEPGRFDASAWAEQA